ncbi:MAG: LysR family transcriptional regulator [Pseudolabrys sp.]
MLTQHTQKLHHFLSVVANGSISRAAIALRMSQPALSKSVRQLEDALKVKLLERTTRGIVLTVFGECLATHARLMTDCLDRAEVEIAALRGAKRGHIRIGAGPSVVANVLPSAIRAFVRKHPDVRISIWEGLVDELQNRLTTGQLDMAIVSDISGFSGSQIACTPVLQDRVVAVAGTGHPFARKKRLRLNHLLDQDWVLPGPAEPVRQRFDQAFKEAGLSPPTAMIETMSASCMIALAQDGQFLTWLPGILVQRQPGNHRLVVLDIRAPAWSRELYLCTSPAALVSPACTALLAAIKTTFQQLQAPLRS